MVDLAPTTPKGQAGLVALLTDPAHALVAFDYDGTLSPIVDDPASARVQPGAVEALAGLASQVGQLAIITGRPAEAVVELAGLGTAAGLEHLVVLGQYGLERWDSATRQVTTVEPPAGLTLVRDELPGLIETAGVSDAVIEDKGLAVAVHVRRSAEPETSYEKLKAPLLALADRADLAAEPGRLVIELRPRGMDKGKALLDLAAAVDPTCLMFTGDDLGDLAAFEAVESWRAVGRPGLLVCSGSAEVTELAARSDLVVDGPEGVLALIRDLVLLLA